MLTTQTPRAVETHGVSSSATFSIKANGKAFKVLIDGLYSDKIRAVIRELWTNAYDAHAMAGNLDTPFECHLPTVFEPVFSVRDFGVGMDHTTIMDLYTTVFASSKENTNSQVGKLGLGSKSPFAYTDSFTVQAWDGQTKRSYSAYIGSDHIPMLAVMGEEPSTDPRGIEVSFPVKTTDIHSFKTSAERTAVGFDVRPTMTGATLSTDDLEIIRSGLGWKLVAGAFVAQARQGCVLYPIDAPAISGLTEAQQSLLDSALIIDFPVGDLEISASRESLGYDDPTKANIRKEVVRIEQEILQGFQDDVDSCKTMWAAALRHKKILNSLSGALMDIVSSGIRFRGNRLEETINLNNLGVSRYNSGMTFEDGDVRATVIHASTLTRGRTWGRKATIKWEPASNARVNVGDTVILIEDSDKPVSMPGARIRHWYDDIANNGANQRNDTILWIKGRVKGTGIARLLIALGRPADVVFMSDLERPPIVRGAASTRTVVKMKELQNGYRWLETDVVEQDENVFVELRRNIVLGPKATPSTKTHDGLDDSRTLSVVDNARKILVSMGYMTDGQRIVGVPATHKAIPKRNAKTWTNLWVLVQRALDERYSEDDCAKANAYNKLVNSRGAVESLMHQLVENPKFKGFERDDVGQKLYALFENAHAEMKRLSTFAESWSLASIHSPYKQPKDLTIDVAKEVRAFEITYPLARAALSDYSKPVEQVTKNIIKYVNLIDEDAEKAQTDATQDVSKAA